MASKGLQGNIVTMDNTLIRSEFEVSTVELRVLLAFISKINNNPEELAEISADTYYNLNVQDYANLYNIQLDTARIELEEVLLKLHERKVYYTNQKGLKVSTYWISTMVEYDKETGDIEIAWAKGIIPFISKLEANFTSSPLNCLRKLKSAYSIRWYLLFYMELTQKRKTYLTVYVKVETIRAMFKLEDKYELFADLKRWVIEPAVKDINRSTNIQVSFKNAAGKPLYRKVGRKVAEVGFVVKFVQKAISVS